MALSRRGIAWRLVVIVGSLTFPLWYPPLIRRVDTQTSRREIAAEAEHRARATGDLIRRPSGEVVRAVVYTPSDPVDTELPRVEIWTFRLLAFALLFQLVANAYGAELQPEVED